MKTKYETAWTWICPDIGMGKFAVATKEILLEEGKMTPESKPLRVVLVPYAEVNKRAWKNLRGKNK